MSRKTLFYSSKEKIAFYIPNYYPDSLNVGEQIKMLQQERSNFARMLSNHIRTDKMLSREILVSSRYKNMRVFWMEWDEVPDGAFVLGADCTMDKWIQK